MAILNKYYTTWTSDDAQMYKLEIIPSHTHTDTTDTHTSGFVNTQLPNDFLLNDMTLDLDLGDIPVGLMSSTLKLSFNVGTDATGVANFSTLRTKLLRGSDSGNFPFDVSWVAINTFGYFNFQCFNTFILSRSDDGGSTYAPIFIGCQKFAAVNELDLTKLSPVIKLSIEAYDITRCIGEMIRPETWFAYLKATDDLVDYGDYCTTTVKESTKYNNVQIAGHFQSSLTKTLLIDKFASNLLSFKIQTFKRLRSKIEYMYATHLRSILIEDTGFTMTNFFLKTTKFKSQRTFTEAAVQFTKQSESTCYISEVNSEGWVDSKHPLVYGSCIGGMLFDKEGFGQFTNFHEVLAALQENFMQKTTYRYTRTSGVLAIDLITDTPIPQYVTIPTNFYVQQSGVFDSVKFKLFNETMKSANAVVSSIKGDRDTTEWTYAEQTTSGDNSKDIKFMFHNLPLLTFRDNYIDEGKPKQIYLRRTINPATLVYLHQGSDREIKKVDTSCKTDYNADYVDVSIPVDTAQPLMQQIITEQQKSGIMQNTCFALVHFMGQPSFKLAEFRTTQSLLRPEKFGGWAWILYGDLNTLLDNWDPETATNMGTVTKYSLDIYSGMADVTTMSHGLEISQSGGGIIPGEG